jgi:hypothetical protein
LVETMEQVEGWIAGVFVLIIAGRQEDLEF